MQSLFNNIVSLTPLKKLIASTVQAQLSRFIQDIQLDSLGLLGGDLVLENLELRRDVVQELLGIPTAFDLSRGFIKELRIHIPWTRLGTRPIEIKFHTIEIIVVPTDRGRTESAPADTATEATPDSTDSAFRDAKVPSSAAAAAASGSAAGAEGDSSTPSWIQTLIKRALANVSITAEAVVLKFDDGAGVVLSATLGSFKCHSADPELGWEPRWLDLLGPYQLVCKLIEAKQLTVFAILNRLSCCLLSLPAASA